MKLEIKAPTAVDGEVLCDGVSLPAKSVTIQMAAGCLHTAQVELVALCLDIKDVEGTLYVFFGDRRYRLVDENAFDVVPRVTGCRR